MARAVDPLSCLCFLKRRKSQHCDQFGITLDPFTGDDKTKSKSKNYFGSRRLVGRFGLPGRCWGEVGWYWDVPRSIEMSLSAGRPLCSRAAEAGSVLSVSRASTLERERERKR